jgi:hypothetical protein
LNSGFAGERCSCIRYSPRFREKYQAICQLSHVDIVSSFSLSKATKQ